MGIRFELLNHRHLEWLRNLRNTNREWFFNKDEIKEPELQQLWARISSDRGDLNLVIFDTNTDERVGFISLYEISPGGLAKVGRMMTVEHFKHQGYMQKALIKVCDIAKNHLGIKELTLEVLNSNIIARDFYVKMGFVTYGLTSEYMIMRKYL